MPEISVIVPVYNVGKFLARCVESILDQTFTDFELILVDDGSTDNSLVLCDHFAERDSRVKVIHQKNAGVSAARNAGLDIMSGNYIMFVDSDDAVHPEILRILYDISAAKGSDISICGMETFVSDSAPHSSKISMPIRTELFDGEKAFRSEVTVSNNRAAPCGKLYRKNLFDGIRFKIGITYEDLHIYPYILNRAKSISSCDLPLYYYFVLPDNGSAMRSPLSEKKFVAIDIQYDHYRFYRSKCADRSAMIAAYHLMLKFPRAATKIPDNKHLRRVFVRYYFRYFFRVITIPHRYLSAKNKLIFLSSIIPSKMLLNYFNTLYKNEPYFDSPNNL